MQSRYWFLIAGMGVAFALAMACVAYLFSGGTAPLLAFAICAMALAVGQALLASFSLLQSNQSEVTARSLMQKLGRFKTDQEAAQSQIGQLFSEVATIKSQDQMRSQQMAHSLSELKTSYQGLATALQAKAAISQPLPSQVETPAPENIQEPDAAQEELAVSLEPIVDLITGKTAHYRVHLSLAAGTDDVVSQERLLHHVDTSGKRIEFDAFAIHEALALLDRLNARDSAVKLFITIGAQTLSDASAMLTLLETLKANSQREPNLVFELPHVMLAGLSATALEGLGSLARFGQPLALAKVSIAGLDPQSLGGLNVRYVSLDAKALDVQAGIPATYHHFVQLARLAKVTTMFANITEPSALNQLKLISRLGSGPAFASPRRVRRDRVASPTSLAA